MVLGRSWTPTSAEKVAQWEGEGDGGNGSVGQRFGSDPQSLGS